MKVEYCSYSEKLSQKAQPLELKQGTMNKSHEIAVV